VRSALADAVIAPTLIAGFKRSAARGTAISKMEAALSECGLFAPEWLKRTAVHIRRGAIVNPVLMHLAGHVAGLESIIRMRYCLEQIPAGMKDAMRKLLEQSAPPEDGWLA